MKANFQPNSQASPIGYTCILQSWLHPVSQNRWHTALQFAVSQFTAQLSLYRDLEHGKFHEVTVFEHT
jgi:hypothetical protein